MLEGEEARCTSFENRRGARQTLYPAVLAALLVLAGCVDLTPPWKRQGQDSGGGAGGEGLDGAVSDPDVPSLPGSGGTGGSRDVSLSPTDLLAQGGAGGAIDGIPSKLDGLAAGGSGGSIDSAQSGGEVGSLGGAGGAIDASAGGTAGDAQLDKPMGGTDGGNRDIATDADAPARGGAGGTGTGGRATGGVGGGGVGTGGLVGTGGVAGTGGGGTGGAATGGSGTGGATGTGGASPVGLVIHYSCNQTSGPLLTDNSGNGHDATLVTGTGGTVGYAFGAGQVGNALQLVTSSQGHASIAQTGLSSATEMTVATWVYLNSAADWQRVWDFGSGVTSYMFLSPRSGTTGFLRFAITTSGNSSEQPLNGTAELPVGTWKHVAVVIGAGGGVLYVDGQQVDANPGITLRPNSLGNTTSNYIGRSQFPDPYLDGNIDEFRVYDRALPAVQIARLAGL